MGEIKKSLVYAGISWTFIPLFISLYDGYRYYKNPNWFSETSSADLTSRVEEIGQKVSESTTNDRIMSVTGADGNVTLYDDRLEISRKGLSMIYKMQHGFKSDKEIPYESITSIQLRKPSSVTRGYVQFGQSGFSETDDGLLDAAGGENTILFNKGSLREFEELQEKVRELKNGDVRKSTGSVDGAMEKLRERYVEGEIGEEEYAQRKHILQQD